MPWMAVEADVGDGSVRVCVREEHFPSKLMTQAREDNVELSASTICLK